MNNSETEEAVTIAEQQELVRPELRPLQRSSLYCGKHFSKYFEMHSGTCRGDEDR